MRTSSGWKPPRGPVPTRAALSLVATLVEAYGGRIQVRRGDERGTTVTLRFPEEGHDADLTED
jgi:two-component sensor histidine kinase